MSRAPAGISIRTLRPAHRRGLACTGAHGYPGGGVFYSATVNSIVGTSAALGFSTNLSVTSSQVGIVPGLQLSDGFPGLKRIPVDQLGPGFGAVPVGSAPNTAVTFFDTDAFRIPAALQFGTAGRGILTGPGMWNIDASWIKSFVIHEHWRAELRAEFFNFLNHANFGLPAHSAGVPAFGTINSASAGRSTQLAARIEF